MPPFGIGELTAFVSTHVIGFLSGFLFLSMMRKEINITFRVKNKMSIQRLLLIAQLLAYITTTTATARKYFFQDVCADPQCSEGCQESQLPQDECLLTTNGGSAVCYCTESAFEQDVYVFTTNCTMYYYAQTAELNVCLNGQTGYVEYACPAAASRKARRNNVIVNEEAPLLHISPRHPVVTPLEGLQYFGIDTTRVSVVRKLSRIAGLKQLRHGKLSVAIAGNVMRVHIRQDSVKDVIRVGVTAFNLNSGSFSAHLMRADLREAVALRDAKHFLEGIRMSLDENTDVAVVEIPLGEWQALREQHKVDADDRSRVVIVDDRTQEEVITLTF